MSLRSIESAPRLILTSNDNLSSLSSLLWHGLDSNVEFPGAQKTRFLQRCNSQFLQRIVSVGNQFSKEDFPAMASRLARQQPLRRPGIRTYGSRDFR